MKANRKLGKIKETIIFGRFLKASAFATAVFVMAFVFIPTIIAEANATNNASVEANWAGISLTLDPDYGNGATTDAGHGDVDFGGVTPTSKDTAVGAYGTQKVAKKVIRVVTSGKYYTVYLSTASDATNNALLLSAEGSTQSIPAISDGTTAATFDSTQSFTRTGWGYAVPGSTVTGADFSPLATYNAYDSNLAGTTNDNLTKTGTGSSFYNTGTWAAVPLYANAQQIYKNNNASGFMSGDTFPVYYSVMADTDVMSGTYTNEIVYTALASTQSLDSASTNMSRDKEFVTSNTVETLKIDLAATSEALTASNVKVYLVPHNIFANNSYAVSSLTATDYNQCTVTAVATTDVIDGQAKTTTITCTMPAIGATATAGTIAIAGDNSALPATSSSITGEYDFWVQATTMGQTIDYVSHYTQNSADAPAVAYVGLQSKRNSTNGGTSYITKMQEMETNVCKNTNMWGGTDAAMRNNVGTNARIYDYTGTGTALANTAAASDALGLGTFALTDNRDSKQYLVRRLADGNCWMVQNLDLELADYAGHNTSNYPNKVLTPANTDLAELGVDYWDPSASANQRISQFSSSLTSQDFLGLAKGILGTTVATTKQFQDYTLYGGDHFWGSKCTPTPSNATTISSVTAVSCDTTLAASAIMNNVLSEIPRSYSNTTSADNSTGFRYVPTKWDTGATTSYGTNAATATTSSFTPTAQGTSSDGNAEGGYFGNMYIGHYYNWYAATAESGTYAQSSAGAKTVDSSICPAGWRLPVNSGIGSTSASGSWGNLIGTTYGLITTEGTQTTDNNPFGSTTESSLRMHELPLSIPFTGYYNWQNGNLNSRGANGYFWSSTPSSAPNARYLNFDSTYVNPQHNYNKVDGFTVRCVAR